MILYMHPLASFCWKVLIALYDTDTPFEPVVVDLMDAESRARFLEVWPMGQFPVLRTATETIPESSVIIEYLAETFPSAARLLPRELAREVRLRDRFYDFHVHQPMQKIVTDRIRPPGASDPHGVEQARATLASAYDVLEQQMASRTWAAGDDFTMADCAAAPALFYANKVQPLRQHTAAYLRRLEERPSFARVLHEAQPYFANFPG